MTTPSQVPDQSGPPLDEPAASGTVHEQHPGGAGAWQDAGQEAGPAGDSVMTGNGRTEPGGGSLFAPHPNSESRPEVSYGD